MQEKFLPIGTVVLLNNGKKRLMINGYGGVSKDDQNTIYDYTGVLFPEGMLNTEQTFLFNHGQIQRIDHLGLTDNEEKEYTEKLKQILR